MKNIKKTIKFAAAAAFLGLGVSSCSLDMLPLNDVVLENYWTNKSDVESVVASCYTGMQENGYITNMLVWGEDRSDNIAEGQDVPDALKKLMKGSLKTTNNYCNWAAMYNVINRCNTVLYYAPKVAEKDPNYTNSDLKINEAEVKALRAMTYLTLIKTFKDVPFSLEPSIDDDMDFRLPATKFEVILDALIKDIEASKDDAPRRYSDPVFNSGKITRAAMYSLLAELYLWRASDANLPADQQNEYYRKCIECCDWVIDYKTQQYRDNNFQNRQGVVDLTKAVDSYVWSDYGLPLLAEQSATGASNGPEATNAIFGEGNSFESIFEISYTYNSTIRENTALANMYGSTTTTGTTVFVVANENIMPTAPTATTYSDQDLFSVTSDIRSIAHFRFSESDKFNIYKYVVDQNMAGSGATYGSVSANKFTPASVRQSYRTLADMNWIMYRFSEVILFRAEAEIELAANMSAAAPVTPDEDEAPDNVYVGRKRAYKSGASLSTPEELYDDAFELICAVYRRSNPAAKNASSPLVPQRADFTTVDHFETLLMNERHREFLFEGKRYFDLVRQARREGNTSKFQSAIVSKYGEASKAVIIKMAMMDFMYMPYLKSQIQLNSNLKQNAAYADEEENLKQ